MSHCGHITNDAKPTHESKILRAVLPSTHGTKSLFGRTDAVSWITLQEGVGAGRIGSKWSRVEGQEHWFFS